MDYMQRIIDAVCTVYGTSPEDLLDPKNNLEPAFAARAALAVVMQEAGETVEKISGYLMMPSTGYTYFLIRRHYDMVQRPEGYYQERFQQLTRKLELDSAPA